jgi:hypothetical protein
MCHTYTYIVKYLSTLIASTLIILFKKILKNSQKYFVKDNNEFSRFIFEMKISLII